MGFATAGLEDCPAAAPAAASATQRHGMCTQKLPGSIAMVVIQSVALVM